MDYGQVGNNAVAACPWCDELFVAKACNMIDDIGTLSRLYEEHVAATPECRQRRTEAGSVTEAFAALQPAFQAEDAARKARCDSHPDNGRTGWWRVVGIRHEGMARASSAGEAIAACDADGIVGTWECPEAKFVGAELPDVF
jgi:hypothetical protein